jgi:hypothetical protein
MDLKTPKCSRFGVYRNNSPTWTIYSKMLECNQLSLIEIHNEKKMPTNKDIVRPWIYNPLNEVSANFSHIIVNTCHNIIIMIVTKLWHCHSSPLGSTFVAGICIFLYDWWGVLSIFPSIHCKSHRQSHGKIYGQIWVLWNAIRILIMHQVSLQKKKKKKCQQDSSNKSWK